MTGEACDVVILGAGLAGAAAACICAERGFSTVVLEARDRTGGRGYTRAFAGTNELLEFGGGWIAPWHDRIRHYAERNAITLRPTHPVTEHRFHDGKTLRQSPLASPALAAIQADALLYKAGKPFPWPQPLSLARYLDRIAAAPEDRAYVLAWWTISGNGDPDRISAAEFLSSCAYGDGTPASMMTALAHTLVPGAEYLAERMIASSRATLHLNAVAATVADGTVTCVDGRTFTARAVICCLPLNALASVRFTPELSAPKCRAMRLGHGGQSIKLWLKVKGVPPGILASGGSGGLRWLFAERDAGDGMTSVVGFALLDGTLDPGSRASIERSLAQFMPEAELIAWDWHDWVGDRFARGTWVALPAAEAWIGDSRTWRPEGRIAFATSDFAPTAAGWFEGAILAGEAAAREIIL
ncbi:MAG TPA: NAD(P)/FAD-dependent oxidoreductase [Nordella sp.]|nr:NAD(P)/FAD-dependent oxidoreductase [Nordella sp.]